MVSEEIVRPEDPEETKEVLELVRSLPPVARLRIVQQTIAELFATLPKTTAHRSTLDGLTDLQRKVFTWFCDYYDVHGLMPTLIEVADAFGYVGHQRVRTILKAIEKRGYIKRRRWVPRGFIIVRRLDEPPPDVPEVPETMPG